MSEALQSLGVFIGEWDVEARFPGGAARGRTVFEWVLGGRFLLQRSEVEHPAAPDGLCVIGGDPETGALLQHYFDSRGVVRVYAMTFAGGVWTLVRDAADFSPLPFRQRYRGSFSDDGARITGAWERTGDDGAWQPDFDLIYTRSVAP